MNRVILILSIVLVTSVADVTSRVIRSTSEESQTQVVVFLAHRNKPVPEHYWKLLLPKDIVRVLINKTDPDTLRAQNVSREDLTKAYVACELVNDSNRTEDGIIRVPLTQKQVLSVYNSSEEHRKLVAAFAIISQFEPTNFTRYAQLTVEEIQEIDWSNTMPDIYRKPLCRLCGQIGLQVPFPEIECDEKNERKNITSPLSYESDAKSLATTTERKQTPYSFKNLNILEDMDVTIFEVYKLPKKLVGYEFFVSDPANDPIENNGDSAAQEDK